MTAQGVEPVRPPGPPTARAHPGDAGEAAADEPRTEVTPSEVVELAPEAALAQLHRTGFLERVLVRGLNARDATFALPVAVTGCILVDADFRGATFADSARFAGSTFDGRLWLGDEYDGIGKATKSWSVKIGTRFAGTADFAGCVFGGPVYATGAQFGGDASFRHA